MTNTTNNNDLINITSQFIMEIETLKEKLMNIDNKIDNKNDNTNEEIDNKKITYNEKRKQYVITQMVCGKRKYYYGKTEEEVIQKYVDANQKLSGKFTVEGYIAYWLKTWKSGNVEPTTYNRLESTFIHHIKGTKIGDCMLERLNLMTVQEFLNKKKTENLSQSSVNKVKHLLTSSLDKAVQLQLIPTNPATYADAKLPRNNRPLVNIMGDDDVYSNEDKEKIINLIYDEYRKDRYFINGLAIVLAFKTGLRIGELVALTWEDFVNEDNAFLIINKTEAVVKEDGYRRVTKYPKTQSSNRIVPLSPSAVNDLVMLRRRYKLHGIDCPYIVATRNNTQESLRNLERTLKVVCKNAGVGYRPFHKIRKNYVSNMVSSGIDLTQLAKIIGHKDISVLIKVYNKNIKSISDSYQFLDIV